MAALAIVVRTAIRAFSVISYGQLGSGLPLYRTSKAIMLATAPTASSKATVSHVQLPVFLGTDMFFNFASEDSLLFLVSALESVDLWSEFQVGCCD